MMVTTFTSTKLPPRDRGIEFGRRFASQICKTVEKYQVLFDRLAGAPVDLKDWGTLAMERISAASPALRDEIFGMAEGSGVSMTSLAAINARTEVLAAVGASEAHECSTVVYLSPRDVKPPVAIQTWDWYASMADCWLVWQIPQTSGNVTVTLTEYGIVGKIGVNKHGLGILFNILRHKRDGIGMGVPVHVLSRLVLDESLDLNQALLKIAASEVSASSAFTVVASAGGESAAVSVEACPGGIGYALPDRSGLLIRTNHFLCENNTRQDLEPRRAPDSILRRSMIARRLHDADVINTNTVISALSSHLLGGGSTCCHVDPRLPATAAFETLAVVSLDVRSGRLVAHAGGPCGIVSGDRQVPESGAVSAPLRASV